MPTKVGIHLGRAARLVSVMELSFRWDDDVLQGSLMFETALLFTGHMIDLPGRGNPRFPQAMENVVADVIKQHAGFISERMEGSVIGVASGARGGDILFLETVRDLGLETRMVLPCEPAAFVTASVAGVPEGDWVDRFYALWNAHASNEREIVAIPAGANPYEAANRRMLDLGRSAARQQLLMVYWDGQAGDGPGGTASFIELVRAGGGAVDHIDAAFLLEAFQKNRLDG